MTPIESYRSDLSRVGFAFDAAQASVVAQLQYRFDAITERELLAQQSLPRKMLLRRGKMQHKLPRIEGLYIWGRVGRGKTYLMDSFYHGLPPGVALRLHFHRFMQLVHEELRRVAGHRNPLRKVAATLAGQARVLCLDEFFVEDIGDAMILAKLLEALSEHGVTLVLTSNAAPDHLYKDGLQRQRFLPAIALLKRNTQVLALDGEVDYRQRWRWERSRNYFTPLAEGTDSALLEIFRQFAPAMHLNGTETIASRRLRVNGRSITTRRVGGDVAWFDFMELCGGPRSQLDYIEISRRFSTVILSDIPILGGRVEERRVAIGTEDSEQNSIACIDRSVLQGHRDDAARRFIALVDEFYDQGVRLIVSAAVPMQSLYKGGRVSFAFRRTLSRLTEMQSAAYPASLGPGCR